MKDRIEDRLRIKVMPDLGKSLDVIDNTYKEFLASKDKTARAKLLRLLSKAAVDAQSDAKALIEMFGGTVFEGPLPSINSTLTEKVRKHTGDDLLRCMNTLAMIAKNFVGISMTMRALHPVQKTEEQKIEERIQLLFQLFITLGNLIDIALLTDAEPPKDLVLQSD